MVMQAANVSASTQCLSLHLSGPPTKACNDDDDEQTRFLTPLSPVSQASLSSPAFEPRYPSRPAPESVVESDCRVLSPKVASLPADIVSPVSRLDPIRVRNCGEVEAASGLGYRPPTLLGRNRARSCVEVLTTSTALGLSLAPLAPDRIQSSEASTGHLPGTSEAQVAKSVSMGPALPSHRIKASSSRGSSLSFSVPSISFRNNIGNSVRVQLSHNPLASAKTKTMNSDMFRFSVAVQPLHTEPSGTFGDAGADKPESVCMRVGRADGTSVAEDFRAHRTKVKAMLDDSLEKIQREVTRLTSVSTSKVEVKDPVDLEVQDVSGEQLAVLSMSPDCSGRSVKAALRNSCPAAKRVWAIFFEGRPVADQQVLREQGLSNRKAVVLAVTGLSLPPGRYAGGASSQGQICLFVAEGGGFELSRRYEPWTGPRWRLTGRLLGDDFAFNTDPSDVSLRITKEDEVVWRDRTDEQSAGITLVLQSPPIYKMAAKEPNYVELHALTPIGENIAQAEMPAYSKKCWRDARTSTAGLSGDGDAFPAAANMTSLFQSGY